MTATALAGPPPAAPAAPAGAIPLAVPTLRGNEERYLRECIQTGWVSYLGPFVDRFERMLAARAGAGQVISTNSGTSALHLGLVAAGVGPGDEVVMPAVTFVAPANAVRYCGAWPVFLDLRRDDWQLDLDKVEDFLARGCDARAGGLVNRATGRRVAALLPVHLLGGYCDVDRLAELATRFDLPVVEDAAQALGGTYKGRELGAPAPGVDPARRWVATSFNGNKIMTTGGGGALYSDDPAAAARARHLSTTAKTDKVRFHHDAVGYNYRLTNCAAAVGVAQLEQLDGFLAAKRAHAARYADLLGGEPRLTLHPEPEHTRSAFWLYTVLFDGPADEPIRRLNARGVQARPVWDPIPTLPAFRDGCHSYRCEFAGELARRGVSLPSSVTLTDDELDRVAAAVRGCL
ncbi:MAG: aminotransferase class I/II-fold pyridoxal phosphate-dependent enzyme [Gemmataceae bacterium]|nr:aminotransferase class I/II-fold pyridoxal phosphate-dependent enzyme [Gemmataceae bacterium]